MTMELLTIKEAAEILKVSPLTVRRYISRDILHAIHLGGGVRIRREELERLGAPEEPEFETLGSPSIEGRPFTKDDPLWSMIGIGSSRATAHGVADSDANSDEQPAGEILPRGDDKRTWRPTFEDDSIWQIADLIDDDGPTDASSDIHEYIADAIEDWHR